MMKLLCALPPFILLLFVSLLRMNNGNEENQIIKRRDIKYWTPEEKQQLLQALYDMKSTQSKYDSNWNSYDYYSYVHNQSFNSQDGLAHGNWAFLPWHREYIYYLEQELQIFANNKSLRLPYWNPEDDLSTYYTLYDTDFIGGDGSPINSKSGLSCDKWVVPDELRYYIGIPPARPNNHSCIIRDIGSDPFIPLPAKGAWDELINKGLVYDTYPYNVTAPLFSVTNESFRLDLEGPFHSSLHAHIGGDVGTNFASSLDPVFFMLHTWIDLMWWKYQEKYGLYGVDDTFIDEFGDIELFRSKSNPELLFFDSSATSDDCMDVLQMGYTYDDVNDGADGDDDELWYETDEFLYVSISIGSILGFILVFMVIYKCCKLCNGRNHGEHIKLIETQSVA